MSIFRNSWALAAIPVAAMLIAVAPIAGAADKRETAKPADTRPPPQQGGKARIPQPPKAVFKPKEKVSAGKPVSFPSDI